MTIYMVRLIYKCNISGVFVLVGSLREMRRLIARGDEVLTVIEHR